MDPETTPCPKGCRLPAGHGWIVEADGELVRAHQVWATESGGVRVQVFVEETYDLSGASHYELPYISVDAPNRRVALTPQQASDLSLFLQTAVTAAHLARTDTPKAA